MRRVSQDSHWIFFGYLTRCTRRTVRESRWIGSTRMLIECLWQFKFTLSNHYSVTYILLEYYLHCISWLTDCVHSISSFAVSLCTVMNLFIFFCAFMPIEIFGIIFLFHTYIRLPSFSTTSSYCPCVHIYLTREHLIWWSQNEKKNVLQFEKKSRRKNSVWGNENKKKKLKWNKKERSYFVWGKTQPIQSHDFSWV